MKKVFIALGAILIISALCLTACKKDGSATYTTSVPDTTKENRTTKAPEDTSSLKDDISEALTDLKEDTSEIIDDASEKASDIGDILSEAASDTRNKISEGLSDMSEHIADDR